jgi:hypothetical protein
MQLPGPVRAFVGLMAVAADEAKHLPDRAIELPMLAVSSALQASLRAQQRYARLTARGDDVISRRQPSDDPPSWATFDDDPVAPAELRAIGLDNPDPAERARAARQLLDELLSGVGGSGASAELRAAPPLDEPRATSAATKRTPAGRKPAGTKAAGKKQPSKRTPTKKAAGTDKATKAINAPRHTAPSRFDTVEDD